MDRHEKVITHEKIQMALTRFRNAGRTIKRLPDQGQPVGVMVGGKWNIYETFFSGVPIACELMQKIGGQAESGQPIN